MVSTRGVKFQYSEGERVLCYEPDPTKAKLLYDSKVVELVNRDNRGRKVPEYLIHFFGWNNSWDRRVKEDYILPYTEENKNLQTKLAIDAALSLMGKRKTKLPPLIKETLAEKLCSEDENKNGKQADTSSSCSSSDSESSEDEMEVDIKIPIPEVLKRHIEEDWRCINQKDKLVKIPCEKNVISILESYVKHLAANLLREAPPKIAKNGKQIMPADVENKLNLCKEAMDGLRVYIDFTLPHILLYEQEKQQCLIIAIKCHPAGYIPSEEVESNGDTETPLGIPKRNAFKGKSVGSTKQEQVLSHSKRESLPSCPKRGRPRLQSKAKLEKNVVGLSLSQIKGPQPCKTGVKSSAKITRSKSTRVLRSTDKLKQAGTDVSASDSPQPTETESTESSHHKAMPQKAPQKFQKSDLMQEIQSFKMVPISLYQKIPAPLSLIYGAQHLVRLFVKLPDLIAKQGLSKKKLVSLLAILDNFLLYLAEKRDDLFSPSAYVDVSEVVRDIATMS